MGFLGVEGDIPRGEALQGVGGITQSLMKMNCSARTRMRKCRLGAGLGPWGTCRVIGLGLPAYLANSSKAFGQSKLGACWRVDGECG